MNQEEMSQSDQLRNAKKGPALQGAPAPKKEKGKKAANAPGAPIELPGAKMEVEHAALHSAVMFAARTGDTWNEAKVRGIKMLWVKGEGLLLGLNGQEMLVPAANVKAVIFANKTNGRTSVEA